MVSRIIQYLKSKQGATLMKYAASSVITTVLTWVIIIITFDIMKILSAGASSFVASACMIPPSYYLNRKWAWGKSGKSHLWKEIVPFWVIALTGLALATVSGEYAAVLAHHITKSRNVATLFVGAANFMSYGILWSIRFVILNKLLFSTHHHNHGNHELVEEHLV